MVAREAVPADVLLAPCWPSESACSMSDSPVSKALSEELTVPWARLRLLCAWVACMSWARVLRRSEISSGASEAVVTR